MDQITIHAVCFDCFPVLLTIVWTQATKWEKIAVSLKSNQKYIVCRI